jgi:DNA mismatch repair protein MutS
LEKLCSVFNTYGEGCKIELSDRDGYTIQVTKRRWDAIKAALPGEIEGIKKKEIETKAISSSSSTVKILHSWISLQSDKIIKCNNTLSKVVSARYRDFLADYGNVHKARMNECVQLVADLDVVVTCARNAKEFRYSKPRLASEGDIEAGSWFDAKGLRHPILERIITRTMYVPNNVALGGEIGCGMLLFGVNSSGKSSLMKAIGLNVIMAQAGFFVAADEFVYEPYHTVFTRIVGTDDIYRGWSTFTVEMMELRNILLRGDKHSLVLGDELCSGTESLSASAIVAAGIETLTSQQSSFMFATHLHDLASMKRIVESKQVRLFHMHVETQGDCIVFDRVLREGVGTGVYGLEVCQGLHMPPDFMRLAHNIRCEIEGQSQMLVNEKASRYSSEVFMDKCRVCGGVPKETHHILPQSQADDDGYINHFHKNTPFNLLPVCEECHDNIHAGKVRIRGFKATSKGIELDVVTKRRPRQLVKGV